MQRTASVLVLGARGRFGQAAARAFAAAGWQVHGQVRPGAIATEIPGVQWIEALPEHTADIASQAAGASVVVNALSPLYTHKVWRREVPRITDAAISITRKLGATLMVPGNVYNYGEQLPALLHEDTPQTATTVKGRLRIESEQRIEQASRDGALKAVVIRGGDFFGSGQGSWLDQVMVKSLRSGKFIYPGALDLQHAWAYLPDMAHSFVQVARERERLPDFGVLHFAGQSVTGRYWADALTDIAWEQGWLSQDGVLRIGSTPWPVMRALGLVMPTLEALCEMRYLWQRPHQLVNTRMKALVGPERHTPFADAVRTALADLGMLQPSLALA